MKLVDASAEWLRLTEHYRKMSDGELLNLARQSSNLTEEARQVLADQLSVRGLKLPPEQLPASILREPDPNSPYAEDRELVEVSRVWSFSDAFEVQRLLDIAGIPFAMGTEGATRVESVTSTFSEGVPVGVMRIGFPWACEVLRNYQPADEPKEAQEWKEIPLPCPRCRSTDVVFERLTPEPRKRTDTKSAKFEWTCESCGHHWMDDGVVKEY